MKGTGLFLIILIVAVLLIPVFAGFSNGEDRYLVLFLSWGMAFIHAGAGFSLNSWALTKSNTMFMRIVLGGIGIRMLAVAIAVVLLFPVVRGEQTLFILTFGFFYFFFHGLEIAFLLRRLKERKKV